MQVTILRVIPDASYLVSCYSPAARRMEAVRPCCEQGQVHLEH